MAFGGVLFQTIRMHRSQNDLLQNIDVDVAVVAVGRR